MAFKDMLARAARTGPPDADNDANVVARVSFDNLVHSIMSAQNRVVHCEAELERARMSLIEAQERFCRETVERRLGLLVALEE